MTEVMSDCLKEKLVEDRFTSRVVKTWISENVVDFVVPFIEQCVIPNMSFFCSSAHACYIVICYLEKSSEKQKKTISDAIESANALAGLSEETLKLFEEALK